MVTLIVVDSLFFSDRYLDRAFLKTRTSIFFCAAINFVRGAKIAQRQLWQNTTRGILRLEISLKRKGQKLIYRGNIQTTEA